MIVANYGSIQLVPAPLVAAVKAALKAQGLDPDAITSSGAIDPQGLFSSAFETVEIRSNLTPPLEFSLRGPSNPTVQALLNQVQPTVILKGKAGRFVIAPKGESSGTKDLTKAGTSIGLGIGAGLLGLLLVGAAVFRR